MFSAVERRLLWNNLAVLGGILLAFALAVYVLFAYSLAMQLDERLLLLARAVALSVESEDGKARFNESIYLGSGQERVVLGETAVAQWLDLAGQVVRSRGLLPLAPGPLRLDVLFLQERPVRARIFAQPVRDPETGRLLGYVRVALALAPTESTLSRLLWGLAGGISLALTLGTIGSLWLTRQAMRPVQTGYRRLQQFTADASHELRSPLTAIKLNAATALRHPNELSPEEIGESFEQIQEATDQMMHLTNDLLLLARADEDIKMDGHRESVSLDPLLGALTEQLGITAQQKQIHLDYQAEGHPRVFADPGQVNRLFRNLVENAIQYTPPGGKVMVLLQEREHHTLVTIADTGIGIAPEHIGRVFDRFWRADKARSRRYGGTGLGLPIALSIARAHGGTINLNSLEDVGSSFVVRLPRWKAENSHNPGR